jgi:hypothetical protein
MNNKTIKKKGSRQWSKALPVTAARKPKESRKESRTGCLSRLHLSNLLSSSRPYLLEFIPPPKIMPLAENQVFNT